MTSEVKPKGHFRSHLGFYSILLLALVALAYVKLSAKAENQKLRKTHEVALLAFKTKADSLLQAQSVISQSLTAKTLAFSIRNMTTKERTQYFDQLIKYKGLDAIAYEQSNKKINASSNKAYLSASLNRALDIKINYQNTDTQTFLKKDSTIICHPVITNGKIAGTLIMVFPKSTI